MRIRSAIVVGSFAAASGAYPQLSIPPEAGKGANSKWHLPPRIRPRAGASDGPNRAREPPPAPARRAPRENRPHSTAGFSAVAGSDAVAPKKNVKVLRPASVGFRTASTARSYASDATAP